MHADHMYVCTCMHADHMYVCTCMHADHMYVCTCMHADHMYVCTGIPEACSHFYRILPNTTLLTLAGCIYVNRL